MTHTSLTGRFPNPRVSLVGALFGALLFTLPAGADPDIDDLDGLTGFDRYEAYFDAHSELKTTRSSGWKPFNRAKWFAGTRETPTGVHPGEVRLDIFQRAQELEQRNPVGAGWFSTGPTTLSGRCVSIAFHPTDPDIVYIGSAAGGLWKSTDGGDTWSTSTDQLPVLAIGGVCVLDWDPDIVLIGTGEGAGTGNASGAGKGIFGVGLFKSIDGGDTFTPTSLFGANAPIGFSVIEDNPTTSTILAAASNGLWRSTDDGDTWNLVMGNGNYFDVKWKPGDPNRVYVTKGKDWWGHFQNDNGVYVSDDDGLTFTLLGIGQPSGSSIAKTKIGVTPADPDVIYAHYVNASNFQSLGVYRSLDDGATWQVRNNSLNMTGGQGWYNLVMAVDPTNVNRIVTGGVNLYTSIDGGVSYTSLNQSVPLGDTTTPHWDEHALAFEPGSLTNLWVTNDGGVWRSTDAGDTWQSRREGIISYQFYDICVAQTDAFFTMGGTQDNGVPGRTGLDEWFESTLIADGMVCNVDPADANRVFAEWQFGNHVRSMDAGESWSNIQGGISGQGRWVTPVDQDQRDGDHLYTETSFGVFRTRSGGNLWQRLSTHRAVWISISPVDGDVVWTVEDGAGVWHTEDDGATWTQSSSFPGAGIETKIQAHPLQLATAFVTFGGYATGTPKLVMTTDFGQTWIDVTGDFPQQPANTFIVDPDRPDDWYIGSDTGVWHSADGGAHWLPFGTGLSHSVIPDLEIRRTDRKLLAGTYGRGVWEVDLEAAVAVGSSPDVPSRNLMLDRPYPYPAGGQVTFRFAARSQDPIELLILDVRGRVVDRVLARAPGDGVVRQVSWSVADLPAGVYFASLRAGTERVSRKLLIAR